MTAAQAASLALQFRDSIHTIADLTMAKHPDSVAVYAAYAQQAVHGSTTIGPLVNPILQSIVDRYTPLYGSEYARETAGYVAETAMDYSIVALWARGKNVYDIDPDLWAQLQRVDRSKPLPADLFSRLRHTDPFVRLPEPVLVDLDEPGVRARITGFFVTGRTRAGRIATDPGGVALATVSTHSPECHMLAACIGGYTEYTDGRPYLTTDGRRDILWSRIHLDPTAGDGSINAMVESASTRFWSMDGTGSGPEFVARMLPQVAAALIYCSAENADMNELPTPPVRRKSGRRVKSDAPKQVEVGYRVGKAIQKGRAEAARRVSEAGGDGEAVATGRVMPPHIRAPHFQRFRIGAGRPNERTEYRVRWVDPIEVNFHLGETVPSVRRVKAAR